MKQNDKRKKSVDEANHRRESPTRLEGKSRVVLLDDEAAVALGERSGES